MNDLKSQPNIGKILAQNLNEAEIFTMCDLNIIGSEAAFTSLATIDPSSCICKLYALEGAIQKVRWHQLSKERKLELQEFFHFCKSQI